MLKVPFCWLAGLLLAAPLLALPLPAGRGVVDVTRPPYNAVPDGVTDCTDALQRALTENLGATIYLPKGVYLISNTLRWPATERDTSLWGEDRAATILRLPDAAPGFTDPAQPKAMIWTGQKPAQRFKNYVRQLTFDTGSGNPGATGAQFIANNTGAMQDVTIRSGDGAGAIGLDLGYTDEQGPCLIKRVRVEGFDLGVRLRHVVDSVTMEDVELIGQRLVALDNDGQVLSVRRLTVRGAPLAVRNRGLAVLVLLDAELEGSGPAALENAAPAQFLLRDVVTSGFSAAVRQGEEVLAPAGCVGELAHPVAMAAFGGSAATLRLPVEETPEVPWGDPAEWVSVEAHGARAVPQNAGRNPFDSAAAFQKAFDSGARTVYVPMGFYHLGQDVILRGALERVVGLAQRAVVRGPGRFVLADGAAPVVIIENLQGVGGGLLHRSERTLVLRNMALQALGTGNASEGFRADGPGRTFLEDVVGKVWHFGPGHRLWARQFNTENTDTKITAERAHLWILGLKCEKGSTLVDALGGCTELLGIFTYTVTAPEGRPMLRVRDGQLSATFGEACFNRVPVEVLLRAERGGEVFEVKRGEVPGRTQGSGAALLAVRP